MSDPTIYVIPAEYYGGAIPKKRPSVVSVAEPTGMTSSASKPRKFSSGKIFFIVVGILFIVVIGGSVWYFTRNVSVPASSVPSAEPVVDPSPTVVPPVVPVVPPPTVVSPQPEILATETPPVPVGPALSEDPDHDGLTEAEEVVYGTKSTLPDTDGDGYLDGHEVTNLYNPSGVAPQKLEAAGLAVSYVSSQLGFGILYPRTWRANPEDGDRNMVFQATDGESISLTFVDNLTQASFEDWLKVQEPNVALVPWTENRQGRQGFKAGDAIIYLQGPGSRVAVLRYNPTASEAARYRATLSMMVNSFSVSE